MAEAGPQSAYSFELFVRGGSTVSGDAIGYAGVLQRRAPGLTELSQARRLSPRRSVVSISGRLHEQGFDYRQHHMLTAPHVRSN